MVVCASSKTTGFVSNEPSGLTINKQYTSAQSVHAVIIKYWWLLGILGYSNSLGDVDIKRNLIQGGIKPLHQWINIKSLTFCQIVSKHFNSCLHELHDLVAILIRPLEDEYRCNTSLIEVLTECLLSYFNCQLRLNIRQKERCLHKHRKKWRHFQCLVYTNY